MKKTACAVLIFIMVICLVNPLSSDARGGHWWGWWAPWAVIGGAAVLSPYYAPYYYSPYYTPYYGPYYAPYYYSPYYYSPYYASPPVVIREQSPAYVQPAPSVPPSSAERIFAYPRQGQSEDLQAKDRYACHGWAVGQTRYDPTQSASGMPEAELKQMRANYQRAMGACLEGRGYTVR